MFTPAEIKHFLTDSIQFYLPCLFLYNWMRMSNFLRSSYLVTVNCRQTYTHLVWAKIFFPYSVDLHKEFFSENYPKIISL